MQRTHDQPSPPSHPGWGGRRAGAGRKRLAARPQTPHRARPRHSPGNPVHVTLRASLGSLRTQYLYPTVRLAIGKATRRAPRRFRVVQFSVQSNHLHLIVEAADARALSSGMRSVSIRIARYVNDLLGRRGRFWADRWHGRALTTPRQVRTALVYVLANFRKHARRPPRAGADPYSSAPWFDGFRPAGAPLLLSGRAPPSRDERPPVSPPRTWLLRTGWRRRGLIALDEAPARTQCPPSPASLPARPFGDTE